MSRHLAHKPLVENLDIELFHAVPYHQEFGIPPACASSNPARKQQ